MGEQDLFREQSKIFQPLINTQEKTSKAIKDGQDINATAVSNVLLPFTSELQRRSEQVDMLTEQPFYHQELPPITPVSPEFMNLDLDAGLDETDRENLEKPISEKIWVLNYQVWFFKTKQLKKLLKILK